jgi:hypothetical protein
MSTREISGYDIDERSLLARAAQIADQIAQAHVLEDYRQGKEPKTIRRQRGDIALFEAFLTEAGAPTTGLSEDLALWTDISAGLVKAFVRWQLGKGYLIGSMNVRISTVKYPGLKTQGLCLSSIATLHIFADVQL